MKRREFMTLVGGAAAWPVAAQAQQAGKVYRVGYLASGAQEPSSFYFGIVRGSVVVLGLPDANFRQAYSRT